MMTKNVRIKPIDKCFTLKTLDIYVAQYVFVFILVRRGLGVVPSPDSKSANDPHPFPDRDIQNFQKVVRLL